MIMMVFPTRHRRTHIMNAYVIAPDKPSGDAFNAALVDRGAMTEIGYADIEPRAIGDRINENPKVQEDLARAIADGFHKGFTTMVIACNTLQLWVDRALTLLPREIAQQVIVLTTFDALRKQFPDPAARPLWLGTTVTVQSIKDFPTLLSLSQPQVQDVVQRIVWRTKGVTGADPRTASADIDDIGDPAKLRDDVAWVVGQLQQLGVRNVVLGCTELPIAFGIASGEEKSGLNLIDPAVSVAEILASCAT